MSEIRKMGTGRLVWSRFDRVAVVSSFRVVIACVGLLSLTLSSNAQDFVSPGVNTNLIAVTPEDNIPDYGHKQQQEPSCIIRPSNSSYIFCAFNDLRASDDPSVQGDSWIGYSMSGDIGKTFRSGLVPGYKGHPNSLNMGFAADASLVAIPGADPGQVGGNATKQTPGLAILNYIGGYRDSSVGVLAIQRFVENEQEDQLPWLPEDEIYIIADGTSGRFIDKPAFLYVPNDAGSQGTRTESIVVEGQADPVSVSTPTGTLIVAYAVFTGSNSIKVMIQKSTNNGRTWDNATKLSESLNEVTGVTLTAIGQRVVASWRQKADGNNGDAIMSAYSSNAGKKWTKGEVMFPLCPFDQPATGVTFRTFAFPWAANDGKRFWTFATDRRYTTEGSPVTSCDIVPGAPPGIYDGVPRIVGMSSADGINWVGASGNPGEPFVLDSNLASPGGKPVGLQVMPSAFGIKGQINIAWYDTRREAEEGLPGNNPVPLINDYWAAEADAEGNVTSLAMVLRKADVWMTRLIANCDTGGGCTPVIKTPVRVSRYPVTFFDDDAGNAIPFETEAHLPNHKLYASGTLAFKGDYISVAGPALRMNAEGQWIPNHAACGASDIPGECIDKENLFVAWGDNRDVRIDYDYLKFFSDGEQVPFTPPPTQTTSLGFKMGEKKPGASEPLVDIKPAMAAVTESDDSTDPTVPPDDILTCSATTNFGRSRDANVYGAVITDAPSLVAPTLSKPLGSIQRTFPLVLNNSDITNAKNFCLQIVDQPTSSLATGRASFLQLPASLAESASVAPLQYLPVKVPAGSSASRALYVIAPQGSIVRVKAFEDSDDLQTQACLDLNDPNSNSNYDGTLQDTIAITDGNLFDSEYCSLPGNAGVPACIPPVAGIGEDETHNIKLALANLQSPILKAPVTGALNFQNLNLQAPPLAALNFQNLNFQNLNFQNLNLQNLNFQNLNFQNLNLQNLNFQNLNFQNLNFQNLNFQNLNFQNLNLQNLNFQNLNLQNLNFQNLNLQNLNFQNLNFQNLNFQNLNLQAPALSGGDEGDTGEPQIYQAVTSGGDVYFQDVSYIVETDANVTTSYTADIALNLDALKANPLDPDDEAVVQLIAWTPNEYNDGTDDCGSAVKFEAQVISAVTLNSSGLAEVNLPSTFAPNNQDPHKGAVSFTSKPGQPIVLTARIWVTEIARAKLEGLYEEWESCNTSNFISECTNVGIGGLISFGASAQSCQTSDTENLDGVTDCLNNEFEKIYQDREPPNVDPISPPDGFIPNTLPYELGATASELKITWPITGTDSDPTEVTFECTIDGMGPYYPDGDPIIGVDTFEVAFTYFFPAGTTPVSCAITDGNDNTTTAEFDVTVNDVTGPVISLPALQPFEADPITGKAIVNYDVSAIDAVAGVVAASCAPASGSAFSVGTTTVVCTSSDGTNGSENSFDVIVNDVTGPVISVPSTITASADALTGKAVVTYAVTANDAAVGDVDASCTPPSGSTFSVGTTTVTCTASDGTNGSENSFDVTVNDVTGPVISVPADITTTADPLGNTAAVNYTVTATDAVDGSVVTSCSAASGSAFGVGSTPVSCSASDLAGNTSTASFTVTVTDNTAPVISVPADITTTADPLGNTAAVNYTVTATDAVDGSVTASCAPASGSTFGVGSTTVNCSANDASGNTSTASFDVIVVDGTGPVITAPDITRSVNYVEPLDPDWGQVSDYGVSATDVIDGDVTVNCSRDDGNMTTDFVFSDTPYDITCTATDNSSNTSTAKFRLTVRYLYDINLVPPKGQARAGSTVPLDWQFSDSNGLIDSSEIDVAVSWQHMTDSSCETPDPLPSDGISSIVDADSGNSDFRYSNSTETWQFSWQSPQAIGWHKLSISPPGADVKDAWECIRLR